MNIPNSIQERRGNPRHERQRAALHGSTGEKQKLERMSGGWWCGGAVADCERNLDQREVGCNETVQKEDRRAQPPSDVFLCLFDPRFSSLPRSFYSLFPFVVAILKDLPSQDAIGPELRSVQ
jgi:hypothetical protein